MSSVDEGVAAHMQGHEGLDFQVSNPIMQLVVTSVEEAAFFTIQGVGDI